MIEAGTLVTQKFERGDLAEMPTGGLLEYAKHALAGRSDDEFDGELPTKELIAPCGETDQPCGIALGNGWIQVRGPVRVTSARLDGFIEVS